MFVIRWQGIELHDQPQFARLVEIHQVRAARLLLVIVDVDLHAAALLGQRRPAERALQLDSVVARRVVRGGNHHAADRTEILDRVRNGGRGRIGLGQVDDKSVGRQDARDLAREAIGQKARIEPDYDSFRLLRLRVSTITRPSAQDSAFGRAAVCGLGPMLRSDRVRDGLRHHAQVGEGEAI